MLSNKCITLSGFVVLVCSCSVQASPTFLPIGQRENQFGPASQRGSDGGNGKTGVFDHMFAPQMLRHRPPKPTPSSSVLPMIRSSNIPTSTLDYSSLLARGHDSSSTRAANDGSSDDGDDGFGLLSREDNVFPFTSVVVGTKTILIPSPTLTSTVGDTVTAAPTHGPDGSNGGNDGLGGDHYGSYDGGDPYDGYPQYSDEPYTRREEREAALTSIAIGSETIFLPSPTIIITSSESTPTPTDGSDGSNRYGDYPPFNGPGDDGYNSDDGSSGETTSA